ncbi:MAG: glycosyl hydrolase family 28-related protein [Erythrobacter sp.]
MAVTSGVVGAALALSGCGGAGGSSPIGVGDTPMPDPVTLATPQSLGFPVPSPEPALPAAVDPFAPPAADATGGPVLTEIGDRAAPGDTIAFTGDGFSGATRFQLFGQSAAGATNAMIAPRRFTASAATLTLPADSTASAMYLVYPAVAGQLGRPLAINRTTARWVGPNQVAAGGTSAVFGVNLSQNHGTTTALVYLQPQGGGVGQFVPVVSVNPYRVEFSVPAGTAAGAYQLWTHNGHGGSFGWSGPLMLTVTAQSPWAGTEARIFDVRDFGAVGDGTTPDDAAIGRALNAAAAAQPSTIFFPAGTYRITRPYNISTGGAASYRDWFFPPHVRWLGAGQGRTVLRAATDYRANANALGISANTGLFLQEGGNCAAAAAGAAEIRDLTIDGFDAFAGDGLGHQILQVRRCDNLRFENVAFNGDVDFLGNTHLFFQGVTFRGNNFFDGASQVFFDRSISLARADSDSLTGNGQEVAITRHLTRDLDPANDPVDRSNLSRRNSGIGSGRWLVVQGGHTRNFYIGDSQTVALGPSANRFDGNSGEQILLEHGGTFYGGSNGSFDGTRLTLPGFDFNRAGGVDGSVVVVASGKGFGQRRTIVSNDPATSSVTIDAPFTVAPDSTSFVVVELAADNIVVYNNRLQGKPDYASAFSASAGVEPYGNSSRVSVDSNSFDQLRGAYVEFSIVATAEDVVGPNLFNSFHNNRVTNGLNGIVIGVGVFATAQQNANIIGNFGFLARDNLFDQLSGIGLQIAGPGESLMLIFERGQWNNVFAGFITNSDGRAYNSNFLLNSSFLYGGIARATAVNGDVPTQSTGARVFSNSTNDPTGTSFSGFATGNMLACTPSASACPAI